MTKPASPEVLQRIRAEYVEMPGLALRPEQVQRLCGVERTVCESALETLVEDGFLAMRPDGAYARDANRDVARRPAKASLESTARARLRAHSRAS